MINLVNHSEESGLQEEQAALEDQAATGPWATIAGELAPKNGREKNTAEMALKTGSATLIALARVDTGSKLHTMITGEHGMKSAFGQTSATLLSLQTSEQFIASGPWPTFLVKFNDTKLSFFTPKLSNCPWGFGVLGFWGFGVLG